MRIPRALAILVFLGVSIDARAASYTCSSFEYPPFVQSDDGHPSGFVVDVVQHVFLAMGHSLSIRIYPVARALELAKAGRSDCVIALFPSPEYAPFLDYTNRSIVPQAVYFYARKGSGTAFDGRIPSLQSLRIGVAHKLYYGPQFESARPGLRIDEAPTAESNFKKPVAGRVDIVPSSESAAASLLSRKSLSGDAGKIVKLFPPIGSIPTCIAFAKSKRLGLLRQEFDEALAGFLTSPQYRQLLVKYGLDDMQDQLAGRMVVAPGDPLE